MDIYIYGFSANKTKKYDMNMGLKEMVVGNPKLELVGPLLNLGLYYRTFPLL